MPGPTPPCNRSKPTSSPSTRRGWRSPATATPDDRQSPLVSPLDAADLGGLPPAMVMTAGCDPLHAQGELYARALRAANVPVEHVDYPGMVHGFFQLPGLLDDGRDAVCRAGAALRAALK